MRVFASALIAATASAGAAVYGSTVCVSNLAGFDLHWWMQDLNSGYLSADSTSYPIDKTKCMSVAMYGLKDGDFIETYIHADGGVTQMVDSAVIYQSSPAITVSYTCTGATLTYSCKLNGEAYLSELANAGMLEDIPVFAKALGLEDQTAIYQ